MTNSKKTKRYQFWINLILIVMTLTIILPFLLVFISSITDETVLIRNGYSFFPEKISFYAYQYIIRQGEKILRAYGVTILITVVGTFFNLMFSALLAYPLSVKTLPYRRQITFFVFFTMLFNGGLVPTYLMYVNYFHIDEWSSLYMLYKYNKVYVSDITFGITQFCTLKCEYCNSFIPKIKNPINYSLEEMKETIQTYFQWVDEVNVLALCGGDAMVYPHFDELLQWIVKEYYPRRAKHIEIYSNAVIVPTEMQLEFFKKNKIVYRFTDYSSMTGKQKITEVIELLERYDIMYDHVQFKEWYDCGYPQKSNGISSEQGLINFFDMCDRKTCHGVWNNKIFFCSMCFYADLIKYCELDESDCFDLKKCDEKRKKEFVEYYLGYNEKGYMNYCKMCNGGMNINTHAIPVGNQK